MTKHLSGAVVPKWSDSAPKWTFGNVDASLSQWGAWVGDTAILVSRAKGQDRLQNRIIGPPMSVVLSLRNLDLFYLGRGGDGYCLKYAIGQL